MTFPDPPPPAAPGESDELRRAREGYARGEALRQAVLSASLDAIVGMDHAGRITEFSAAAETLFGYARSEALGKPLADLIVPERLREAHRAGLARHLATGRGSLIGKRIEMPALRRDGSEILVELAITQISVDAQPGFVGFIRDVTDRRRGEDALRASEEQVRLLLESTAEGIYGIDLEGRCTFANAACLRILGYHDRGELIGRQMHVLIHHSRPDGTPFPAEECSLYRAGLEGEGISSEDQVFWRADGTSFHAEFRSFPIRKDGQRVGAVVTIHDITARLEAEAVLRRTENQLREVQKLQAVGSLAAGVAHDFNNILAVIATYSEVALEQLPTGHPVRADMVEVRKASLRGADLTNKLLAFSRREKPQPRVVEPASVLTGMEKMLRRLVGDEVQVVFEVEKALGSVVADPSQLEQVMMNLVVNARDAMPRGGKLTITARNVPGAGAFEAAPGHHGSVQISVSDTGVGMDEALRARIFEPFFTTKEVGRGTGLGLSTVTKILEQTGGRITVESEVGRGSTFRVFLPRTESVAQEAPQPVPGPAETPSRRGGETILLVEDHDQVRTALRSLLERHGYRVLEAHNGGEAYLVCEDDSIHLDLVLSDVAMRRLNGRELAEHVAVLRPRTPVILISGHAEEASLREGGFNGVFLQKPILPAKLLAAVRTVLDQSLRPS